MLSNGSYEERGTGETCYLTGAKRLEIGRICNNMLAILKFVETVLKMK